MSGEHEKIACHVCRKEIPKAAALSAEGVTDIHGVSSVNISFPGFFDIVRRLTL